MLQELLLSKQISYCYKAGDIFTAKAPASLMLLGEHAVLEYGSAIAVTVDKHIYAKISVRSDQLVKINSNLGSCEFLLADTNLQIKQPFSFVCSAILELVNFIKHGFELDIQSNFSHTMGLGSSSAVTVAVIKVILKMLNVDLTVLEEFKLAKNAMLRVQKIGSATDIAASCMGGVIAYHMQPLKIEKLNNLPKISYHYVGYKMPTTEVIKYVANRFQDNHNLELQIKLAMHQAVLDGIRAIDSGNWQQFGKIMHIYQGLMVALGISDNNLENLMYQVSQEDGVIATKISGSGLGDCIVALRES